MAQLFHERIENSLHRYGFVAVAGVDEVGRGCLAGPVMAGAVILHPDRRIDGLADSKTTEQVIAQMTFDDTFIANGNNLSFVIQGLDKVKTSDSKPGSGGNYNKSSSDDVSNAAGEGQSAGKTFVITGSIKGNRSAKLSLHE